MGVLALQGAYAAHRAMLETLHVETRWVREPSDLNGVVGLIIPGGESTTIGKLLVREGLDVAIREAVHDGLPVFGTCAGMILMASRIVGSEQPRLGVLDVTVARNAFGRQVDSFEANIDIRRYGATPIRGVFIRAPYVVDVGPGVQVLARYNERVVAVQQNRLLAAAFHPELTTDNRMHRAFLDVCLGAQRDRNGSTDG